MKLFPVFAKAPEEGIEKAVARATAWKANATAKEVAATPEQAMGVFRQAQEVRSAPKEGGGGCLRRESTGAVAATVLAAETPRLTVRFPQFAIPQTQVEATVLCSSSSVSFHECLAPIPASLALEVKAWQRFAEEQPRRAAEQQVAKAAAAREKAEQARERDLTNKHLRPVDAEKNPALAATGLNQVVHHACKVCKEPVLFGVGIGRDWFGCQSCRNVHCQRPECRAFFKCDCKRKCCICK